MARFEFPENIIALHLNYIPGSYKPFLGNEARELSEAEKQFSFREEKWEETEDGYGHVQATKPQITRVGLNDSPAGLAAWIIEKFRDWGDCDGEVERRFTKDELLTNVMIYWATETIHSSMRLYFETRIAALAIQGRMISCACRAGWRALRRKLHSLRGSGSSAATMSNVGLSFQLADTSRRWKNLNFW